MIYFNVASAFFLKGKNNDGSLCLFDFFVASAFFLKGKNNALPIIYNIFGVASAFFLKGKNNRCSCSKSARQLHLPSF